MKTEQHNKRANWGIRDGVCYAVVLVEKTALDEDRRKRESQG